MINPQKHNFDIAGKYDGMPEQIAVDLFVEIQGQTTVPIKEVMDVTSAGSNGLGRNSRLTYRQLQANAADNRLIRLDSKGKPEGVYANLVGAYAEAITLESFRHYPYAVTIYEPASQSDAVLRSLSSIGNPGVAVSAEIGRRALNSFGAKTPDILLVTPTIKVRVGDVISVTSPQLHNVVSLRNPNVTGSLKFTNKTLMSPIEITVTSDYKEMRKKVAKFAGYSNSSEGNIRYVPILILDRDNFNKLSPRDKQVIVKGMHAVGGVVVLIKDLAIDSYNYAKYTAERLIERTRVKTMNGKNTRNTAQTPNQNSPRMVLSDKAQAEQEKRRETIENNISQARSVLAQISSASTHEQRRSIEPAKPRLIDSNRQLIDSEIEQQIENPRNSNRFSGEESIASRRYQAIKVLLEKAGMQEGNNPDWIKGILYTSAGTGLKNRDIQDIVEQIPSVQVSQAAKLVTSFALGSTSEHSLASTVSLSSVITLA